MAQQDGSDRGCKETCARREASCIRQAEQRYFGSDPMTQELEVFSYCREVQEACEERAGLDFDSLCTDLKSCMQQVKKQLDEKFRAATDLCASDERECVAQCA